MARKHITIRMSRTEKERLERVSQSYGMDNSEFIRKMTAWVEQHQPRLIIEPQMQQETEPA